MCIFSEANHTTAKEVAGFANLTLIPQLLTQASFLFPFEKEIEYMPYEKNVSSILKVHCN